MYVLYYDNFKSSNHDKMANDSTNFDFECGFIICLFIKKLIVDLF
jgi:hypothetical protein